MTGDRLQGSDTGRRLRLLVVNGLGGVYWLPRGWRLRIYRWCGLHVEDATIFSGTIIRTGDLHIGSGSFVNHRCLFDQGSIRIGRNVYISSGVLLASGDHEPGAPEKRAGRSVARPVVVEDGVWIGAHAVVLGGVTIARGCVVGAGAVVTRTTDPDGVYVGVPARRVRTL